MNDKLLANLRDPQWIVKFQKQMGETEFWQYRDKVYKLLGDLQTGQSIIIDKWVKEENTELFLNIAQCFVSENECYMFYDNYSRIKKTFNVREMETINTLLARKRGEKITEGDVGSFGGDQEGAPVIFASEPAVPD